jgi:galactonate dehydratase
LLGRSSRLDWVYYGNAVRVARVSTRAVRVNHRGDWLFVRVETDDGLVGWGESSHSGDDAATRLVVESLAGRAVGRSPFDVEAIVQPAEAVRRGIVWSAAASGLEHALWDVVGKAVGQPVHRLLGGRLRDRLRLYANVNRHVVDRAPAAHARAAAAAVEEGFTAVKCAPFDGVQWQTLDQPAGRAALRDGLERVRAIRRAVGAEVDLLVDCHWRFDVPTALRVAEELAAERLYWLEDPGPADDPVTLLQIKARLGTRLTGGERLLGRAGFLPLLQGHAVDVIMPDLKHVGGILEGKKIAAMAETHGLAVAPHSPAGPVATAAGAQLCATLPNFLLLEHAWGEVPWRAELVGGEPIDGGEYVLSEKPGLGIEMSERLLDERSAD